MAENEELESFTNYYNVLECDRNATSDHLKKCYQRLALSLHPDKINDSMLKDKFLLVQKAWTVLKDPESRRRYDAELVCHEHKNFPVYATLSLSDMFFSEDESVYTYQCRCGGTYVLETINMLSTMYVSCDDCSFVILVNVECAKT